MEEIGTTIGPATELLTVTEPGKTITVTQHYFLADWLDMRLDRPAATAPNSTPPTPATSSQSGWHCPPRP
jgi:hypothetical protein